MTKRVCARHGCGTLVDHDARNGRCPPCNAALERDRGSASSRGYDHDHRAERAAWQRRLDRGERVECRRAPSGQCLEPDPIIRPDEPWQLGHPDHECPAPRAPEHRRCNLTTAPRRRLRAP